MKYELNIYKLGEFLYKVTERYKVDVFAKIKLSGGFMTMTGKVELIDRPKDIKVLKGNNIITLKVSSDNLEGSLIKITGVNNKKFDVDLSLTKFKQIGGSTLFLNKTKENKNECKIRIDEDIIFTVRESKLEDLEEIIEKCI
ncbi:UDP-N-acetylglucosamine pyrophosphorylase [Caproiciproducens sp. MSJ-32]|uniref:UDP-N-acetylglucosamine pyrophosphorylase n=1 Tax=Caproiciproducens sp. MSJ-32 TaxID=2841527 RepID=UPI001C1194CA|nr:UDP-N-acetylglucosamine pyrophosphorylase [Caproiciproducens sp. MSJ-32]MBU5454823.1 UDP-N-acetylglucosamine pyrophosphorylase [Caproiciproducens sp. MSJ-32]